jgi:hypothetical protein
MTQSYLASWQARFHIVVPAGEVAFVRGRLREARTTRAVLVAVGVVVAGLPSYMNLIDPERSSDFANPLVQNTWLLGGIVGALIAEIVVAQRPLDRVASSLGRRPGDYVDLRWVQWVGLAVPLTAALAAVSTALAWGQWGYSWLGFVGAIVAIGGLLFGLRAITDRAALAPDGDLRDIDDALRADGAHHLAGVAVALAGTCVGVATPDGLFGWWALFALFTNLVGVFALGQWWTLARTVPWSVARARASV